MFYRSMSKMIFIISLFFFAIPNAFAVGAFPASTHTVTIQPIIVSDDDGSNMATFFGLPDQKTDIEGFIDNIWGQAGIDVNFLSANVWSNTFANSGSGGTRPGSDLRAIVNSATTAGVIHTNPDFINMFFVNTPAGFSPLSLNSAAGLAFVGNNGITQYVGSNLLDFGSGRDVIAGVVAHEIGHNLGLSHTASRINNLMSPSGSGNALTIGQIDTVLNSRFVVSAVPLPAAIWFMGSGLIGLISFSRKRGQLQNTVI